eukprot:gene2082-2569_t
MGNNKLIYLFLFSLLIYIGYSNEENSNHDNLIKPIQIVLVHGAWADGSGSWKECIPKLASYGYNVTVTQHPMTSLSDDVEYLKRLINVLDGPVILVGHSYGGAIITEASIHPNVKALVYIAAFAPDVGEDLAQLLAKSPTVGLSSVVTDRYGYVWIDRQRFGYVFAQDLDPTSILIMSTSQQPIHNSAITEKIKFAGWRYLPTFYQISRQDRMIHPNTEFWMAQRMNPIRTVSLNSSHCSMLSQSQYVVDLIVAAVEYVQNPITIQPTVLQA